MLSYLRVVLGALLLCLLSVGPLAAQGTLNGLPQGQPKTERPTFRTVEGFLKAYPEAQRILNKIGSYRGANPLSREADAISQDWRGESAYTSRTELDWNGSGFTPRLRDTLLIDTDGFEATFIEELYNGTAYEPLNRARYNSVDNGNGRTYTYIYQDWNGTEFGDPAESEFRVNANGDLVYSDLTIPSGARIFTTFDDQGRLTEFFQSFPNGIGGFFNLTRLRVKYDFTTNPDTALINYDPAGALLDEWAISDFILVETDAQGRVAFANEYVLSGTNALLYRADTLTYSNDTTYISRSETSTSQAGGTLPNRYLTTIVVDADGDTLLNMEQFRNESAGTLVFTEAYENRYNSADSLVLQRQWGSLLSTTFNKTFARDEQNRLTEVIRFFLFDDTDTSDYVGQFRELYTYDDAARTINYRTQNGDGAGGYTDFENTLFTYDSVGRFVQQERRNVTGGANTPIQRESFTYDSRDRVVEELSEGFDGGSGFENVLLITYNYEAQNEFLGEDPPEDPVDPAPCTTTRNVSLVFNPVVQNDSLVQLVVTTQNWDSLLVVGLDVVYDEARLQFEEATNFGLASIDAGDFDNVNPGNVGFNWAIATSSNEPLNDGDTLFVLNFSPLVYNENTGFSLIDRSNELGLVDLGGCPISIDAAAVTFTLPAEPTEPEPQEPDPCTTARNVDLTFNPVVQNDSLVQLVVTTQNWDSLMAVGFDVVYDEARLQFDEATSFGLASIEAGNFDNANPGNVGFDWAIATSSNEPLNDGDTLFVLNFSPLVYNENTGFSLNDRSSALGLTDLGGCPISIDAAAVTFTLPEEPAEPTEPADSTVVTIGFEGAFVQGDSLLQVAVVVQGFDSILTAQFSVDFFPDVLEYVGAQDFAFADITRAGNFNEDLADAGELGFAWFEADANPQTLASGDTLFVLNFVETVTPGDSVRFSLDDAPVVAEVTDQNANPVTLILEPRVIIKPMPAPMVPTVAATAAVSTFNSRGIPGVKVLFTSADTTIVLTTDSTGQLSTSNLPEADYMVSAAKLEPGNVGNAVSTLDLLLTLRHVLQNTFSNPLEFLAGDVNGSESVTAADVVLMRSLILGKIDSLPVGNWLFPLATNTFANPMMPFDFAAEVALPADSAVRNVGFLAVRVGDVNDSYNVRRQSGGTLRLLMPELEAAPGTLVKVPVSATLNSNMAGMQLSMQWNPALLHFKGTEAGALPVSFNEQGLQNGLLGVQWHDNAARGITLVDEVPLFTMVFEVSNTLAGSADIVPTQALIGTEAYNEKLEPLSIEYLSGSVRTGQVTGVAQVTVSQNQLLPNQPNPVQDRTAIVFMSRQAGPAQLKVYNLSGVAVYGQTLSVQPGRNEIGWQPVGQGGQYLPNGVYVYELTFNGQPYRSKLVVNR